MLAHHFCERFECYGLLDDERCGRGVLDFLKQGRFSPADQEDPGGVCIQWTQLREDFFAVGSGKICFDNREGPLRALVFKIWQEIVEIVREFSHDGFQRFDLFIARAQMLITRNPSRRAVRFCVI